MDIFPIRLEQCASKRGSGCSAVGSDAMGDRVEEETWRLENGIEQRLSTIEKALPMHNPNFSRKSDVLTCALESLPSSQGDGKIRSTQEQGV